MDNIIECRLDSTCKEIYTGIWQHDYGQMLRITGVDLPKAVEVQFSLRDKGGDTLTRIGTTVDGVTEVKVPDSFLKNENCTQNYLIYAWIYVTDDTSGNTEYQIILHVKSRPKPEEPSEEPLPEPNIFHETVEAVNAAADRAEAAGQNAKASAIEAGKYAASASESAVAAEKTKEDAFRKVCEKKREAIEAIQEQEETSVGKIINHTDNEIQRVQDQTAGSKKELEQTITDASVENKKLEESIRTAGNTKTALDKSTELAKAAKTELDMSTQKADEAKTALDGSAKTASEMQETLSATVKQACALDTSLGEKIETGTQLNEDITASGEKAVQDIQTAGSEQLDKMQNVAEEFTADREQITTNKEDISSLKDEMSKNYLDDAKTKRSLDALWKLNQGISYQFETDAEKAYQKDIPSGAKLASVKKIGGRTVVWNQLATNIISNWNFESRNSVNLKEEDGCVSATINTGGSHILWERYNPNRFIPMVRHKYYVTIDIIAPKKAYVSYNALGTKLSTKTIEANIWITYSKIISPSIDNNDSRPFSILFSQSDGSNFESGDKFMFKNIMVIDLTKMFGEGNEPSTPEEFEALFPEDYYPYNEGELMSMPVNEVDIENANLIKPSTNFIDKSEYASKGVKYTYDADKVITINGTFKEDIVGGLFGIINYKNLPRYGDYTISVFDENNMLASDVKFNTGENEQTFNYNANNGEMIITLVPTNGKTYINKKYYLQLIRGEQKKTYSPYHKNTYPIPQAILNLDGYGDGVSDDVYNYIDWENKKYHKRVGRVDLGSLTYTNNGTASDGSIQWKSKEKISKKEGSYACMCPVFAERRASGTIVPITNGICDLRDDCSISLGYIGVTNNEDFAQAMFDVMLYYELAEEQIIDISDIIDNTFQEPIEVEAGGTLTFCNSNGDGYQLPIPNEEEYIVSLADIGGGASE